ncbi:MAG: sulfatase-like hydrolase/transferase, partial [Pseudomonadota bacterium]|nr:sulfatase-like hydrolase/transferase [Pseudomonadota bacterium]
MGPEFSGRRREEDYPVTKGNRAPNIVLIMADQLAPQFTGAYGHPVVKTPHIDALAGRGMRFDSASCNSPL